MDYPVLTSLLRGHLHQDWGLDFPDVWAVIDDYLGCDKEVAARLACEIAELLKLVEPEEALTDFIIVRLNAGYYPPGDGYTTRGWLSAVRQRAREVIAA